MDTVGDIATGCEGFSGIFYHLLGVTKYDATRFDLKVEEAAHDFNLRAITHLVIGLFDGIDGQRFTFDRNLFGIAAEFTNQAFHATIHRCGEEQRLALFGHIAQDNFHIFTKAHIEHPVGFIENAKLDCISA